MQEIWKPIQGYEGYYEVSNSGRVRSLSETKWLRGKELKPQNHKYLRVCLKGKGKNDWRSIHRLVAIHFVDNPNNFPEVNHKDGNKYNNWDWNLEWSTPRGNKDHAKDNYLYSHGESHNKAKLTDAQVIEIHKWLLKRVRTVDIAEKYGVHKTTIEGIKTASFWKHLNLPSVKTRGLESNKTLLYEEKSSSN